MSPNLPPSGHAASVDDLVSSLNRAIFMRESQQAARAYEELITKKSEFSLTPTLQYDLARLLELGNEPRMALHAYERILTNHGDQPIFAPSLRAAGHLAYRLKSFKKCRAYLEKFLGTDPPNAERVDAENILTRLPDGKGVPQRRAWDEAHPAGQTPSDQPTPLPGSLKAIGMPPVREEDSKAGGTGAPIAIDQLYIEPATEENAYQQADANAQRQSEEPSPVQDDAFFSAPTPHEPVGDGAQEDVIFKRPSSPELPLPPSAPPARPKKIADLPPTAKVDMPDEKVEVEDPGRLVNYDEFAETPPLQIGSRDIGKKLKKPPKVAQNLPQVPVAPPAPASWAEIVPPRFDDSLADAPPAPAPKPPAREPEPKFLETCLSYSRSEFAVLLPIAKDIRVDSVVRILRKTEALDEDSARQAILDRKGLLREKMAFEDLVEFYKKVRRIPQKLNYFRVEPGHLPENRHDVMKAEVLDPGLRLTTSKGARKVRWEQIRLIDCARLDRQPTVDLFVKETCEHFRLRHPSINFDSLAEEPGEDESQSCKHFLAMLREMCPNAILSHTVTNLLSGKTYRPQKFGSEDEYRRYNMCLLLAHFGTEVDPHELLEVAKAIASSGTGSASGSHSASSSV